MLRDREKVSSDAGLSKLSVGDFPVMRMASAYRRSPSGFPVILRMVL